MQLKKSKSQIERELIDFMNYGYSILTTIQSEFIRKKWKGIFSFEDDQRQCNTVDQWTADAISFISSVFPTYFEIKDFEISMHPEPNSLSLLSSNHALRNLLKHRIRLLDQVVRNNINRYDDARKLRIFIDEIYSFKDVEKVIPGMVIDLLDDGLLNQSEDFIQISLEEILTVPFHKKDWGGEVNDLYTANIIITGVRVATAFLLKGNGLKKKILEVRDCGKNGNQIIRLCDSPAQLFIIQFVGEISEYVVRDIEGKVNELQLQGKIAQYCIMDGQDTARILRAYGKL